MIAFNGAVVYDCAADRVLHKSSLPIEVTQEIFDRAHKAGIYVQTYNTVDIVTKRHTKELDYYVERSHMTYKLTRRISDCLDSEPQKVILIQAILCTCFPCTRNTKNMMFTTIKSVIPHISQRRGLAKFAPTIMRQIRGKPPISKRIEMPPAHIPTSAQINAGKVIALSHSMLKTCAAEATIMLPAESPTKNINIAI